MAREFNPRSVTFDELAEFVDSAEEIMEKHDLDQRKLATAVGYKNPYHLDSVLRLEGGVERGKLGRMRALVEASKNGEFKEVLNAAIRRTEKKGGRRTPRCAAVGGSSGKYKLERAVYVENGKITLDECHFLNTRRVTDDQGDMARTLMEDLVSDLKVSEYKLGHAMGYVGSGASEVMRGNSNPTAWKFVRLIALHNAVERHGKDAFMWFLKGGPHAPDKPIDGRFLSPITGGIEFEVIDTGEEEPVPLAHGSYQDPPDLEEENGTEEVRLTPWAKVLNDVEDRLNTLDRAGKEIEGVRDYMKELADDPDKIPALMRPTVLQLAKGIDELADSVLDGLHEMHAYLGDN